MNTLMFDAELLLPLSGQESLDINAGSFMDGLCHVIEGAICVVSGAAAYTAATAMTGTTVTTALCMIGAASFGTVAVVCGVVAIGYGIYEISK